MSEHLNYIKGIGSLFYGLNQWFLMGSVVVILISLPIFVGEATAADECINHYGFMRYDDKICKRDLGERKGLKGFQDRLKYIPLADNIHLSIGGEVRQRYEYTRNQTFGRSLQNGDGAWLQRLTLHGDLQVGDNLRLFAQGYHTYELGRANGPGPLDENLFEFQNAFVEASVPFGDANLSARLGRQEIALGAGRLLSVREGPNNRLNFDAVRITMDVPDWQIDGILALPVTQKRGAFDDEFGDTRSLWGVYATGGSETLPIGSMDIYYLGFRDDFGSYVQGNGLEERHSIGARYFGSTRDWDWDLEGTYQFGTFSQNDIRAWMVQADTGFTFADVPGKPRLSLKAGIASGDKNPSDQTLGTFNALYERADYFSEASVLGTRNFISLHPSLEFQPADGWTASVGASFNWRLEKEDGVYGPAGFLVRAPGGSNERYVATALSLNASYQINNSLNASATYSRVFAGDFIRDTGTGKDTDLLDLTLQLRF